MPNPRNQTRPGPRIDHHVGGFDVFVDQAAGVQLTECGGQTSPDPEATADLHRWTRMSNERFTTGILEEESGTARVSRQRKGPNRPCGIQFVPQRVFVLQHLDGRWSRMLQPRQHGEHGMRRSGHAGGYAAAAQDQVVVLEESLEAVWQGNDGDVDHWPSISGPPVCRLRAHGMRPRRACAGDP
jgi:hypothetical protein